MIDILVHLVFAWIVYEMRNTVKTKKASGIIPSIKDYVVIIFCGLVGGSILYISLLKLDEDPVKGMITALLGLFSISMCIWMIIIYRSIRR